MGLNTLNAELNPICHLLALLGAHRILHVSELRVNLALKGLNRFPPLPSFPFAGTFKPKFNQTKQKSQSLWQTS